jgi:hypothetical protein
VSALRAFHLALAFVLLVGCESGPPFERSCGGAEVDLCGPREWADLSNASLEPPELPVADFSLTSHIRVELAACDDAPAPHVVELSVLAPVEVDGGGAPLRVMNLLTLEDGRDGDAVAGDGIIDVEVSNPFLATVPAETDVTLRFSARSTTLGGCTSGVIELPYRTGPMRAM